ncbi:glycosyl hydrolase 115 family protein [Natronorubrum halophilum]|uniref:glycosyl hydrolase 115 family protein n=1 Tax=Natronorubrum halophilum TaxID=1702106 RepID=UPI000EF7506A|nr:glycosyl hydrolase 115 family protein [Natronorubrum halophilum]
MGTITGVPSDGDVPIVYEGAVADLYVDEDDHEVAKIATADLGDDIERVTGRHPAITGSLEELSGSVVIVGTVGRSEGVERCLRASDVDVAALASERESFVLETVDEPLPGVDSCLVIAGSDRRGTAYGAYELSERMGVSPWYWWADVPAEKRDAVVVESGTYRFGPPSVTYRGIFLNDEDFGLRPWASETFAPEVADDRPGIGPTTYARIFELLLRLKANTVWPAMHPDTKAFYRYSENPAVAEEYAIVVGTSHCEPLHRNNVDEWDDSRGEWNYATNREEMLAYWRERVEDVADSENVFTLGMRGIHDSGMPGGKTRAETIELLQRVIDDQRRLLDDAHERPVEEIPQVFCPYKEVLDVYRGGLDVPENVCLLWPDDNHGYVRELPTDAERRREGGSGMYYHLSYWGRPHDYLWLSSVPPSLVRTELVKAYDAGARDYWVVNVGDIKPTETELEFALDLAWDVEATRSVSSAEWLREWATREFGGTHADDIAEILAEYYRLSLARKPEHMGWSTVYPDTLPDEPAFSFVHEGDEARRRIDAFERLEERAESVYEALPTAHRPSYYQLVLYQVRCAAAMSKTHLHAARSRLYAGQGRTTANRYAELAERAHRRIEAETRYYNEDLRDGKWDGMLSHRPRDLPVFDVPATGSLTPRGGAALGVVAEGHRTPARGDESPPPSLPTFDPGVDAERFIDVFTRGDDPLEWSATASEEWIDIDATEGTVAGERRLWVGIDWSTVPDRRATGDVTIEGAGVEKTVRVEAASRQSGPRGDFVEVDGAVAIEAEHYSGSTDGDPGVWTGCDVPGRVSGTTVAAEPATFPSHAPGSDAAPVLEYDIELSTVGSVEIEVHCLPTQALNEHWDLRYAVSVDDGERAVVSIDPDGGEHDPQWQRNVLRGAAITTTMHTIEASGTHTLQLRALDPGLVVDRIVVYADRGRRTYLGPRETPLEK